MPADRPAEPWFSFLTDLDAQLDEPVDFHCIGGFVVSQYLGFGRETADLDPRSLRYRVGALHHRTNRIPAPDHSR